jgi:YD repeat-containing protein
VKAYDSAGNVSAASETVLVEAIGGRDTEAPTIPRELRFKRIGKSDLLLFWKNSQDNEGVIGYEIYKNGEKIAITKATEYLVTGLSERNIHTFFVKAFDAAGNVSATSETVLVEAIGSTDTEAPTVPNNLRSIAKTTTSVTLTWDASQDNVGVAGYEVYQGTVLVEKVADVTYTITGLEPGTEYAFTIKAYDKYGNVSDFSSVIKETTLLDKPVNLNYLFNGNQVILTWDAVIGASGYKVYRNNELIGKSIESTTFIDKGFIENVDNIYEIVAYNAQGNILLKSEAICVKQGDIFIIDSDITLDEDKVYNDLYIQGGIVDLNGYRLTVKGNLQQSGGTMYLNGGTLEVQGNYDIGKEGFVDAYLKMINEADYVKVHGDFFTNSKKDHTDYLTAGILEVKGNFTRERERYYNNFCASGTHKVILSGEKPQELSFTNRTDKQFNILEMDKAVEVICNTKIIANTLIGFEKISSTSNVDLTITEPLRLEENILLNNLLLSGAELDLAGKTVTINEGLQLKNVFGEQSNVLNINKGILEVGGNVIQGYNTEIDLQGGKTLIKGSLSQNGGTLKLNGGILEVDQDYEMLYGEPELDLQGSRALIKGSLSQNGGTLKFNSGTLEIYQNYLIEGKSSLEMVNEADYMKVGGNFCVSYALMRNSELTAGTIEVKGDFTQGCVDGYFKPSGTHKVILSGENFQSVNFGRLLLWDADPFNILILTKPINEGYLFNRVPVWRYLVQNYEIQKKFGQSGIQIGTGNFSRTYTDLEMTTPGFQINLSRTYNSLDNRKDSIIGRGWTFGFEGQIENIDSNTDYKIVRLPKGEVLCFKLNEEGTYTAVDSRNTLVKGVDGTHVLTTKDQYTYGFNPNGRLTWMKDRNGNTITINLDASTGRINTITDQVGRTFALAYNSDGCLEQITAPLGRTVTYQYADKQLVKVTDPRGYSTNYRYTSCSLGDETELVLTEIRDHDQNLLEAITYYSEGADKGKVHQNTDKHNNIHTYTYDNLAGVTEISDSNGRITKQWYDLGFNTTKKLDPEGKLTLTEYTTDENGNNKYSEIKAITDRNGNKTSYERDERGNITKQINPDNSYKEFTYDEKNNLTSERDEAGKYTFYIYDADKINLIKKVQPLNGTDQYVENGDETSFAITQYTYYTSANSETRARGLLQTLTDPESNQTTYTYDQYGNIQTEKDSLGNLTTMFHNVLGWKTEEISPMGYHTQYTYDQNGNLEKEIRHQGETTRITYDALGRKTKEILPNLYDSTLDTGHNYSGDHGYHYTYTASGEIATLTDPENNITTYTYDLYGNLLTETKPNGAIYLYEYDLLNRPIKLSFKEGADSSPVLLETFSYTILSGGKTRKTQTKYLNDTMTAQTIFTYDYAGRLLEQQNPDSTKETCTYYPNGQLKTQKDARGSITTYEYDGLNRLTAQWLPVENNQYIYQETTYDKAGNIIQERIGQETVALNSLPTQYIATNYTYDQNGKLKTKTDSEGRRTIYEYDADGNLIKEEIYTDVQNKNVIEYENNHLAKPVTQKQYIRKGDLSGYDFNDTTERSLLTTFTYDKNGNLKTTTTPDGVTTSYTYDNLDRQTTISQPGQNEKGEAVVLTQKTTYTWDGQPLTVTDAKGYTTIHTYNQRGQLAKTTDALEGVTAYYYDRGGRLIAEVSPANYVAGQTFSDLNRTVYTYDTRDRLLTQKEIYKDPATGNWLTITSQTCQYDANGNLTRETDGLGYQTKYTYNLANQLTSELDPVALGKGLSFTYKYQYDTLGRKAIVTDANGVETIYTYDQVGNKLRTTIAGQTLETNTYDLVGNLLTQTDGNGNTTTYIYNALGKVRQTTTPSDETIAAEIITYQYDVMGNLCREENSQGKVVLFTYNPQGRVLSQTQQNKQGGEKITLTYRYDLNGNKCYETDGCGNVTTFTYDKLNRLNSTTKAGQTTTFTYDANSNLLTETNWRGNTYTYSYDPLNRLIEKLDPEGKRIEKLVYNNNHQQIKSLDALDNTTTFTYDKNNRLLKTTDPRGYSNSQTYDYVGNIITKTDGKGNLTQYTYDEFNRILTVTNALNEITTYTYDLNGNLLTQQDGRGNLTTYRYNVANKIKEKTDPLNFSETYTYYPDGNLKTKRDRNGQTTTYIYDCHGRLIQETVGTQTITYTYDANGNQLTITDSTGTTTRTYDALNRVTSKTVPYIGTTTYQYDLTNGLSAGYIAELITDPQGNSTQKTSDRTGRLKEVTADGETTTYTYYDNGNRASVLYPNGVKEEYEYFKNNWLSKLTNKKADGTVLDTYTYTYDQAGNQTSKKEIINNITKGTTTYTYDKLNRLATVKEPNGNLTAYTYDAASNRATEKLIGNGQTIENVYTYNEQNRLLGVTTSTDGIVTVTTTYTYDNNGNQLTVTENGQVMVTNTYDVWNQLIKTVTNGSTVTNIYNGEGLRVAKEVDGVKTQYLYEYDKIVLEVDEENNVTARNVYGLNLPRRTVAVKVS